MIVALSITSAVVGIYFRGRLSRRPLSQFLTKDAMSLLALSGQSRCDHVCPLLDQSGHRAAATHRYRRSVKVDDPPQGLMIILSAGTCTKLCARTDISAVRTDTNLMHVV
jgi:hypothetical protein